MDLDRYLGRIGVAGRPAANLDTLARIHRAHLGAIPYENLDIHLGRPLHLGAAAAFAKLVDRRRGGWCYEMNGLLGWALEALGFRVDYLAGTVGRERTGDVAQGNHLLLLVHLERPYLADVGFGDGLIEPVPLAEGPIVQEGFGYRLSRSGDRWIFHNHPGAGAASFDFTVEPHRIEQFAAQSHRLQTLPESSFVQHTVCQRWTGSAMVTLRGAVLRSTTPAGTTERDLESREAFSATLAETFGLDEPGLGSLWEAVWRRHQAYRGRGAS